MGGYLLEDRMLLVKCRREIHGPGEAVCIVDRQTALHSSLFDRQSRPETKMDDGTLGFNNMAAISSHPTALTV
jgi:hypothetical protein